MGLLQSRTRVAMILISFLLIGLWFDSLTMIMLPLFTMFLGVMGVREYHRMARNSGAVFSFPLLGLITAIVIFFGTVENSEFVRAVPVLLAGAMILIYAVHMKRYGIPGALIGTACAGFSLMYIALPLSLTLQVLRLDKLFLLFGLVLIWSADSGAYFVGMRFGKHKMAPNLSPKKTIEGFFGGVAACSIVAVLFGVIAPPDVFPYRWYHVMLLGAAVGGIAPLGDLAESVLKRDTGVKDSGRGMGGHGGILDRIDSMLFCMPVYYVYLFFIA